MALVVPQVLSGEVLDRLKAALATAEFVDGKVTAQGAARDVKRVLQLPRGSSIAETAADAVQRGLAASAEFVSAVQPSRIVRPQFMRYDPGMEYGPHYDAPIFPERPRVRADVSVTLFLCDRDGYDGGELVIEGEQGTSRYKEAAGDAVVYASGTRHFVEPITRGTRIVAVTWVQSLIRGYEQRRVLHRLSLATEAVASSGARAEDVERLRECHSQLLRMWAET